ncbi:MAG: CBS domain-containing protein [Rhodospirillaceae bacterium]
MTQKKKLSEVMNPKKLIRMPSTVSAADAARKMLERQVGAIVVMEGDTLHGIVTERDINYRVVAVGRDPATTTLFDIMTKNPKCMAPSTPVVDALDHMQKQGHQHMPLMEDGKVVGIVSARDIFLEVKRALEQDLEESDRFIVSGGETTH